MMSTKPQTPPIVQWSESAHTSADDWNPRGYYERAAPTLAALHAREGPFADARWDYIVEDLAHLRGVVRQQCSGRILDLGCGEGLWLDHYAGRATAVTLIDLSPVLLSRAEARARQQTNASMEAICVKAICVDAFGAPDRIPFRGHDSILIAFLLSHYSTGAVVDFLRRAASTMDSGARLLVMDSWHSPLRRRKRQADSRRTICAKGEQYSVRKRYVTSDEWRSTLRDCGLTCEWQWWGKAFFGCACAAAHV